jgi:hypothetical protein
MRYYGCKSKLLDFLSEGVAETEMRACVHACI